MLRKKGQKGHEGDSEGQKWKAHSNSQEEPVWRRGPSSHGYGTRQPEEDGVDSGSPNFTGTRDRFRAR